MGNGFIMQIRGGGTTGGETDADFSLNPRFTFIKKRGYIQIHILEKGQILTGAGRATYQVAHMYPP